MGVMKGGRDLSHSERRKSLEISQREALALLAALEISPFEEEELEQKLLDLVYSSRSEHLRKRPVRTPDLRHRHKRPH